MLVIRKSFFLAILLFCICMPLKAEITQKIYLDESRQTKSIKKFKFQKVGTLSCTNSSCFNKPTDVVISADGSFILVADSPEHSESVASLKKFTFSSNTFINNSSIPLIQGAESTGLLNLIINKNNNKVIVIMGQLRQKVQKFKLLIFLTTQRGNLYH